MIEMTITPEDITQTQRIRNTLLLSHLTTRFGAKRTLDQQLFLKHLALAVGIDVPGAIDPAALYLVGNNRVLALGRGQEIVTHWRGVLGVEAGLHGIVWFDWRPLYRALRGE